MKTLSREEKERLEKLNEIFLYNIGYAHMNNICAEADAIAEQYKDLKVPEELNQWFVGYSKKLKRKESVQTFMSAMLKYSKRVALACIALIIVGSAVTLTVEAYRVPFLNRIIETTRKFSLITDKEQNHSSLVNDLPGDWTDYYYPTYLPEDFRLENSSDGGDMKRMTFQNAAGDEIRFIQSARGSEAQVDSEHSTVTEVEIQGNKGILFLKDNYAILSWAHLEKSFILQGAIDQSTLLKIAKSLQKN